MQQMQQMQQLQQMMMMQQMGGGGMGCGSGAPAMGGGKGKGKKRPKGGESDMVPSENKRPKGGSGVPGGPTQRAEVRYDDAATAQKAMAQLNGTMINSSTIEVEMDEMSKDGTRVKVTGIPSETGWQEVKDLFNTVGRVAFADIKGAGKGSSVPGYASHLPVNGIVRYESPEEAQRAIEVMNGSQMGDRTIDVKMHGGTTDKTKIQIFGMPPGTEWQELKDHFGQIGKVAFSETLNPGVEHMGIVRYDDPAHAQQAMQSLNGSKLGGAPVCLELDRMSKDLSRVIVHGIAAGIEWQELKDHFNSIGRVAFCEVKGSGKGKGNMKGMNPMMGGGGGGGGCGGGMNPMMAMLMQGMGMLENMKGKKGKGRGGPYGGMKGGSMMSGQVSFANPLHAQFAISMLNHSTLQGSPIMVDWDSSAGDDGSLWVDNLAPGTSWQDLKDHFSSIGLVTASRTFANAGGGGW